MQLLKKIFPKNAGINSDNELFNLKRVKYFLLALIQLIGLLLIVKKMNIEKNSGISEISLFIIASFTIISFSSLRFKPFFFFITAVCIIYFAFGFYSGTLLIGGALTLICICHLPIKLGFRVGIILLIFTGMALLRLELFYSPRSTLVVPFLASMFMFRIVLYLFELKYNPIEAIIWNRLSYFFIFLNTCFLFFPVIDYKTYVKTYFNSNDKDLWQKGIRWMLRGVVHYIGYRIIYYYICLSPGEVLSLPLLLQYIFSSYALILRISGLFHFIIGLLCMFGFNLHPVFDNYFLATSFVDLWRRINIYWREFMLKVFFYPLMFKIKKVNAKYAIPLSTICVFVITWFLHNYQLFWLQGTFQLIFTDIIFWLTLGMCITINVIINEKNISKPKKERNKYLFYLYNIVKIAAMFIFMSVMWSLWTSPSLSEWFFLMSKATRFTSAQLLSLGYYFILLLLLGIATQIILSKQKMKELINMPPHRTLFLTLPCILVLLLCSFKVCTNKLPIKAQVICNTLSKDNFNDNDKKNAETGYYKKVMDGGDETPKGLWEINLKYYKRHSNLDNIFLRTNGLISRQLKPSAKVYMDNYSIETNSFGLRDKEYPLIKDRHSFRIALLGGSYEMGIGVNNNEVFESLTELDLNNNNTDTLNKKYEIINFAMNRYHLIQHVELCNTNKVFNFNPNALIYFAHSDEEKRFLLIFSSLIQNGTNLKYPFLENIKNVSGVKQSMSESEIIERLKPYGYSLIMWSYMQIENACYIHHTKSIWAYLPCTDDILDPTEYAKLQRFASLAGFITLDLRGVYENHKKEEIQVSKSNTHPNVLAHKLIAKKFYEELMKNKKQIFKFTR